MSNWGMLMGVGKGLQGFGEIMGEHRKNNWENMREEVRFQRQKNLAELQMRFQKEENELSRTQARDLQTQNQTFTAGQNELQRDQAITLQKSNQDFSSIENDKSRQAEKDLVKMKAEVALDQYKSMKKLSLEEGRKAASAIREATKGDPPDAATEMYLFGLENNVDVSGLLSIMAKDGSLYKVTGEEMKIFWEQAQMEGTERKLKPEAISKLYEEKVITASNRKKPKSESVTSEVMTFPNKKSREAFAKRVVAGDPKALSSLENLTEEDKEWVLNYKERKANPINAEEFTPTYNKPSAYNSMFSGAGDAQISNGRSGIEQQPQKSPQNPNMSIIDRIMKFSGRNFQ